MARSDRDIISQNFTITNFTEDLTFDANTASLAVTNDVLATLIQELKAQGIIAADIS